MATGGEERKGGKKEKWPSEFWCGGEIETAFEERPHIFGTGTSA